RGTIHHIRGSDTVNGEANRLLEEYQIQASAGTLLFRRWPLKRVLRGAFRSSYFSQNSGETYQYIGGSNQTVTFNNAPGAVVDALHLIQTRLQAALGRPYQFNELLSVAYLEKQLMAYHSDNEQGLGPVVAGLSLGSPAVMNFRTAVKPQNGQHRAELTLLLQHGDILVMEGAGVQDYYELFKEPENFRIAVTARHI
ncbi:alpha-ketoglutarate-dependent dioxygenase AlkB-like protein, partial [Mycena leptocephala]